MEFVEDTVGSTTAPTPVVDPLANPILNGPYDPPERYFHIGSNGPTGEIKVGRRPSESSLINDLRREVGLWRARGYARVTPITRNLLLHWADANRDNRVLFCQREAAETAIFLAEVAGRDGFSDWRLGIDPENQTHNDGLPRLALKMATGTGKTVVMAMLIAWQTLNQAANPRDTRFVNQFLVIAPGITIRDRLRVLLPNHPDNYYDQRDLIPAGLRGSIARAHIIVTNYHAFMAKDVKEIKGVSASTRALLLAGKKHDPFRETPEAMVSRVLRDFSLGRNGARRDIVIFNDEAHHCYRDRSVELADPVGKLNKRERSANAAARVWFRGVRAVARRVGVKAVYDLSATPFYLAGSGYDEGRIFPWTVSDFSLLDAIESGIVKVPRTPVDGNATGDLVTQLHLWEHLGAELPRTRSAAHAGSGDWVPPALLERALRSLYASYRKSWDRWSERPARLGEPPPVFIVVCPNTVVSRLVYEWIAGRSVVAADGTVSHRDGNLELFSNSVQGVAVDRPQTILVDSTQLESGETLKGDFKKAAAAQIEVFKRERLRRSPGAEVDHLSDEELLREVVNTVGEKGRLGETVRCVVSVAMLTEGWDANTVTHILGLRAFGSQLLCEQVVGRGLRRRSYAINEQGRFEPEYANVYGIPFDFIPSDKELTEMPPSLPATEVASVVGREHLRITFPNLDGYRLEIPDAPLRIDTRAASKFHLDGGDGAERTQRVAYQLTRRLLDSQLSPGADRRPWLFPQLLDVVRQWLRDCVEVAGDHSMAQLLRTEPQAEAAERIHQLITSTEARRERLQPMLRRFDPVGSTAGVRFLTRKAVLATLKSEVSHVVLDAPGTHTPEYLLSRECERADNRIAAYAKNDHCGFAIPYLHGGRSHCYVPDFLLRLDRVEGEDFDRVLIVEVGCGQKSPGRARAAAARDSWCVAVNNLGTFGRWGHLEITSVLGIREVLHDAVAALYSDAEAVGDREAFGLAGAGANEARCGA